MADQKIEITGGANTQTAVVAVAGLAVVSIVAVGVYELYQYLSKNKLPDLGAVVQNNITAPLSQNPLSKTATNYVLFTNLPSNYQGASVTYGNDLTTNALAINKIDTAFASGQSTASIAVTNYGSTDQTVSTYGGAIANALPQSGKGSPQNPYIFSDGYKGAGSYTVSPGDPIISITSSAGYKQEMAVINTGVAGGVSQGGGLSNLLPKW